MEEKDKIWIVDSWTLREKVGFYSKISKRFDVMVGNTRPNRTLGQRKISLSYDVMRRFEPYETIVIRIENDMLTIDR